MKLQERLQRRLKRAKAEGYSESERPYRALALIQGKYAPDLKSENWLRRMKGIQDVAFEWVMTDYSQLEIHVPDEIGEMAAKLLHLAKKADSTGAGKDIFKLMESWLQFQLEIDPVRWVAKVRKPKSGKGGRATARQKADALRYRNMGMKAYAKQQLETLPADTDRLKRSARKEKIIDYLFNNQRIYAMPKRDHLGKPVIEKESGQQVLLLYNLSMSRIRQIIVDPVDRDLKKAKQPK